MASFTLPATGTAATAKLSVKIPKKTPDALVLPVFNTGDSTDGSKDAALELPASNVLSTESAQELLEALEAVGARATVGEHTLLAAGPKAQKEGLPSTIIAVGLGSVEDLDDETLRRAAGVVGRHLSAHSPQLKSVATTLNLFGLRPAVEGWILGSYHYAGLSSKKTFTETEVIFLDPDAKKKETTTEFNTAVVTADAVNTTRDWVNTPSNFLYPKVYAQLIEQHAKDAGVEVTVLDKKELTKQGFGGVLAVGQGSEHSPRVVQVRWQPKKGSKKPDLALVGKGITFDTGGISLKPAANMENMISDMGGSAAVINAVLAAARLNLPITVTGTVALAENMPSGSATRPGDVITHYGGITSEIINTDAEGRVVLGDAIAFASEDKPAKLVETSTLTGAQIVALGNRTAAVMGSEELRDTVAEIGRQVGENAWAMPLLEEHDKAIESPIADIRNVPNSRDGGMLYAGTYLEKFVGEDIEWAHVDIAGPSFNTKAPYGYTPARATGNPVRTFVVLMEKIAEA